jgi:hypothetical protein
MDTGTQDRGLNASMGCTDFKVVRHLICREKELGYPSWRLVVGFVTLLPTTKPWFAFSATAQNWGHLFYEGACGPEASPSWVR